jgi:hypothetical protein
MLTDESNKSIQLCMWGDLACKFDLGSDDHPVIALKRVTISEYNGKSLSTNESTSLQLNPKITRTK